MKISLAQINTTVGDISGNCKKILQLIQKAKAVGGDIVIFPELALIGYPPRDLLELPYIVEQCERALQTLVSQVTGIAVVVGSIESNSAAPGKFLFNTAYWLEEGKIRHKAHKSLLPFYDVFDETRYFQAGNSWEPVDYRGFKIGLTVCEDIWTENPLYDVNPAKNLASMGANLLINISASPYSMGKYSQRQILLQKLATTYHLPVVYVNQVGGNDELIFDGGSMVINSTGTKVGQAPFFKEGMTMVDLENSSSVQNSIPSEMDLLSQALQCGLKDYLKKCGFKKVALGLSGGIDSALVATLAAKALGPKNVLGLLMPSRFTHVDSRKDALELAKNLKIKTKEISIKDIHATFEKTFRKMFSGKKTGTTEGHGVAALRKWLEPQAETTTEENIQARIRGNLLMALSNKEGYLVLSTGNKSELAVGYCTLYGDMSGGLAVISDLPKTLVYKLAQHLSRNGKPIPQNIFDRPPTAELKLNQTDQDTLPPYEILDGILKAFVEDLKSADEIVKLGYDKKIVNRLLAMIQRNEYKRRQAAPGLRVTSKAFGMGRRFPIACKF